MVSHILFSVTFTAMLKRRFILIVFFLPVNFLFAQNTLPDFSIVKNSKNENVISWRNPFGSGLVQLTVQRSTDTVKNFKTVSSAEMPSAANGSYSEPSTGKYYYRIAYMLSDGKYFTTPPKTVASGWETPGLLSYLASYDTIVVSNGSARLNYLKTDFARFRDSILNNTADTLKFLSGNDVFHLYHNPNPSVSVATTNNYRFISNYMYINVDGNPVIRLPYNDFYNYSMIIYNRDGRTVMYRINNFESNELILSKASFIYPGFYNYELFYNNVLRDKNKIEIR